MNKKEILYHSSIRLGEKKSFNLLIEECAELIVAMQHLKRSRPNSFIMELIHVSMLIDIVKNFTSLVDFKEYNLIMNQEYIRMETRNNNNCILKDISL